MIRWHRAGWRLFWRFKSRPGRPRIPTELRALIRRMAIENGSWGEERIADELLVKLGTGISADCQKVHAEATAGTAAGRSALVDVSDESRQGNIGVRLLCDGDGHVSHAIRVGGYRAWHAAAEARGCDGEPDCGVDTAAVERADRLRW